MEIGFSNLFSPKYWDPYIKRRKVMMMKPPFSWEGEWKKGAGGEEDDEGMNVGDEEPSEEGRRK